MITVLISVHCSRDTDWGDGEKVPHECVYDVLLSS